MQGKIQDSGARSKGVQDNSMKVFEPSVQWASNNTAAQIKEDKQQ